MCKKQQFEKAKMLLNWMWDNGFKPDVFSYGTLINALTKNEILEGALEVFDKIPERGVDPDVTLI